MKLTYKDHLKVTPLPDWASLNVPDIFTPVVLVGDNKKTLVSYKELFYKEGTLQTKSILLGQAGAGKTTFCQHLADVWCNPKSKRQFDDVDVLLQHQFLFYVSFRFAENNETVLDMIKNQLFDDEEMKDIACHVLKHNSDSCLILMDGFDELQRSAIAQTGKRGDITGFPSMVGVQNCVFVITSRPGKYFSLPEDEQKKFSRMELDGIKDEKELVKTILQKLEEPDPEKSCYEFQAQIKNKNMSKIMKSPLMLIFAIDIWESERSLPKSICINYIKIIESFIHRFQTKLEEVITENTKMNVQMLLEKYSESANLLPNLFSNHEISRRHAGLFLSLGHLAFDYLLGQEKQLLVFQKDVCKMYGLNEVDGSLKLCLELGILTKLESTMRGIKRTENFQFCHKSFQEFFAALWLSTKYTEEDSQEKSTLLSRIKTEYDLLNYGVLLNFLCGLRVEAGTDFWTNIAQENMNISVFDTEIQNLILNTVKEARGCCGHQEKQLYYYITHVVMDKDTSDEDVSYLYDMIIQSNSAYLKSLTIRNKMCLTSFQYHSILSSVTNLMTLNSSSISGQTNDLVLPCQTQSQLCALDLDNLVLSHDNLVQTCTSMPSLSDLKRLRLNNLSCSDDGGSCCLSVLDLHRHHKLETLILDKISISGLILPSQKQSQLRDLNLGNLVLSHDNLVQLSTSLSSLSRLLRLHLTNLSCSDDGGSCHLSVLDLHKHHKLCWLSLDKISISGLVLPSQKQSQLCALDLDNLVLSHDNLVQTCTSMPSLSDLKMLRLTNLSCSDDGGSCCLSVLDLHRHHKLETLLLDKISISGLILPSQEQSQLYILNLANLVLSHDNLVQLCTLSSSLSSLMGLVLDNLSCSDDGDSCHLSVLDLHRHHRLSWLKLNKISISGLVLPSQNIFGPTLCLDNLVLSHDTLVQLCTSLSSLPSFQQLNLTNLSCSDDGDRCHLSVLDLHRHHRLQRLELDKISISGLILPSQEQSQLWYLYLYNLVLSHDSLVQLCTSLSSLSSLHDLRLTNLSCGDDGGSCHLSVLDLHRHNKLWWLRLDKISISGLILPSQEQSQLGYLELYNLVLSHDNLVQLCTSLSSLSRLERLRLTNLSCSDDGGSCHLSVLDLHRHNKLWWLRLDKISLSGLILPSQEQSQLRFLYLDNLVLSHDNLVQLSTSLSSLSRLMELILTNLSCSDDGDSCHLLVLDLHRHNRLLVLNLDKISISGLILPSQEQSQLRYLYLYKLVLSHDSLVQLCTSLSSLSSLHDLRLTNLSCSDDDDRCHLSVLDLHRHHRLQRLELDKISISGLILPSQEQSQLWYLYLYNLVLSHDSLVQLCTSMSTLSSLHDLRLTNLSCSCDGGSCHLSVLDLHRHNKLWWLRLDKISISGLILPSQEQSQLRFLYLDNLVLSHDNLVQLSTSLSSLSRLMELILTNLSCSDDGDSCHLSVLDLHRHNRLLVLNLDKISISGLILPSQEQSQLQYLYLYNLVLSHDSLVQLCTSLSSLSSLHDLRLTNLSCSDDGDRCHLSVLDLHRHHRLQRLELDKISISGLILPSQEQSQLQYLYLYNLVLSHDSLVQLCTSMSTLSSLHDLRLTNLSCSDDGGSCHLSVLDLHRHNKLWWLRLDKISISGLILPSQEQSQLGYLELYNLVLSHDNLVQLCTSLSSLSRLERLRLTNLSCSDDGGSCHLSVLDLHRHNKLWWLRLDKISLSGLILPSQEQSQLRFLYLDNLVLSHDNLVQLSTSLSSLSRLMELILTNLSCSDDGDSCHLSVLDLHRHNRLLVLNLDKISISGLILPSQEQSQLQYLYLYNLVLSHDSLVQLCTSMSTLSSLHDLRLTNLSCSDDGGSCHLSVLDLHRHNKLWWLRLDKISISGLILPSQQQSQLQYLYLYNLVLSHDSLVQLCTSLSSLSSLHDLRLTNLSCSDDGGSCHLSVLDLHRHHRLQRLELDKISISGLILPSQEQSQLRFLYLYNLVLSHDNLVQLCTSLSSLSSLHDLRLTNLSCSDDGGSCHLSVLDLHRHNKLWWLRLDKISISGLILPSQEQSQLRFLYLDNLVLSHDNLVQLSTSLSSLSRLMELILTNLSCSDDGDSCHLSVLDLHRHNRLLVLNLDKISISGLIFPSQGQSQLQYLELYNLVLSHDSLVQLCTSLSSLSSLHDLRLTNLSCSDDGSSCRLSVLDLHRHHRLERLELDKISISGLILPSQEQSQLRFLYLYNLVLSHDSLVQLCTSMSTLSSLHDLRLTNLSCSDDGGSCHLSVLDLHRHNSLLVLKLNKISISGLILPSQEQSQLRYPELCNLVLSHDNLVQLSTSLSSLSRLEQLRLTYQDQLQFRNLYMDNLVLSHDNLVHLCTPLSSLSTGNIRKLDNLSCSDHSSICCTAIQDIYKQIESD